MSAKEKREAMQRLQDVPQNEPMIVIATGKYVGEGLTFRVLIRCLSQCRFLGKAKLLNMQGGFTDCMTAKWKR